MRLLIMSLSVSLLVLVGIYGANVFRKRQIKKRIILEEEYKTRESQLREAHDQELARHEGLLRQKEGEMLRLKEIYQKVTKTIQQELDTAKSENLSMRQNYFKAQHTIEEINMHYDQDHYCPRKSVNNLERDIL
jgi:hypothetical protein